MSEYRKLKTQFTSRTHLRTALQAAGIPFEEARPGQTLTITGYGGQQQQATFAVRRRAAGNTLGDLGWQWDGKCFVQVADHMDESPFRAGRTLQTIKREYAVAATIGQARAKGYRVQRHNQADGSVQLVVTGRI
jgi:hypothetical protein